jgi:uncharacterized protein with LGFP repeats
MSQIDHIIWTSVIPDLPLNTDAAIYRLWRSYRDDDHFLGCPISPEVEVAGGAVQQAFASGAVIEWSAENGARLVSS